MEHKSLKDLKGNPKNPRKISSEDYNNLVQSIKQFGDLSGIVKNRTTDRLVGGHQRTNAMRQVDQNSEIVITEKLKHPNKFGTVAVGYVNVDGERYGYREVEWDEHKETAANIAANRIQGEFDLDLLGELTYELSQNENGSDLLALTGQTENEVNKLLAGVGAIDPEADQPPKDETEENKLTFALTKEQREIVEEALGHLKATREMATAENTSMNGNALYYMARDYLDRLHGLVVDEAADVSQKSLDSVQPVQLPSVTIESNEPQPIPET